ncbi:MAG: trypsin-like peptidase domain-containing protein [Planctomycetes bacterium]|nr:trypsin-like peptidase domain-containing protein [Planctomycetota bacterium]
MIELRSPLGARQAAAAALLAWTLAPAVSASEVDDLRELERRVSGAIEAARRAFVFLAGGSGFLIGSDGSGGYVLTNAHVVADAADAGRTAFAVHLTGGKPFVADLVGRDPEGDVALLKLRGDPGVPPIELGDSEALRPGQQVIALGDPFLLASESLFLERPPPDYEPSASLGVVSAVHRSSDTYTDAIQVDAALNRGNSGGPLLTLEGKAVGINGKIEMRFDTGTNTGVGYAIPTSQVQRFLEPLRNAGGGIVRHGVVLGVEVAERSGDLPGLPVKSVKGGSPAEAAGLRAGDVVLSVEGLPVRSRTRFAGIAGTYPAGHPLALRVARGAGEHTLRVPLVEHGRLPFLGLQTKTDEAPDGGARVVKVIPGSPADRAGLRVDDVIVSLAGRRVMTHTDLELTLLGRAAGDIVDVSVQRDAKSLDLKVLVGGRGGPRGD